MGEVAQLEFGEEDGVVVPQLEGAHPVARGSVHFEVGRQLGDAGGEGICERGVGVLLVAGAPGMALAVLTNLQLKIHYILIRAGRG